MLALAAVSVAVLASACASQRALRVHVATPTGSALGGVTVAWVCEPSGDAGATTDGDGVASLTLFNSNPKRCVVTVAKPGYRTQQLTVEQLAEPVSVELEEAAP